jgi:hypothetical protein
MGLAKIISGGQTGIDRGLWMRLSLVVSPVADGARLDAWPKTAGSQSVIPLIELKEDGYSQQTLRNVLESDGTAILYFSQIEAEQRRHSCFASKSTSLTSLLTQRRSPLNARRSYSSRSYSIMALRCLMWQARGKAKPRTSTPMLMQ